MRRAFIKTLLKLAEENQDIYLLTGDAGFTILEEFRQRYPERYLNVGIAEAAMIGIAAGLALSDKCVFCYSIVPFVTMRCFEQVRIDLCYQKLPVKLIGVGQGVTYGTAGATHHAIEDIAVMRALPNMTVICPGDPLETEKAVTESLKLEGPCYIRLGKSGEPSAHDPARLDFIIGRGIRIKRGESIALISAGNMLSVARDVWGRLSEEGFNPELVSMHTVKPLDRDLIGDLSRRCRIIATLEEHNIIGGLGSAVGDVILEEELPVKLLKFGIPDIFAAEVGDQNHLRELFGISPEQVFSRLKGEMAGDT